MLFKKLIILFLLSSFIFPPVANAKEESKTTENRDNRNVLKNQCDLQSLIQSNKASQDRGSQPTKRPNPNRLTKFDNSPKELIDQVWQTVYQKYIDPNFNQVDWQSTRDKYLQNSYQDFPQAYSAIKEMLDLLNDPYTRFLTPEEYDLLSQTTEQSGIGVNLGQDRISRKTAVIKVADDSPALEAGIIYGDVIKKIGSLDTSSMSSNQIRVLLKGKPDSTVNISVERDGKLKDFNVVRKVISPTPSVFSQIKQLNSRKISYIRLNTFDSSAAQRVKKAIENGESEDVSGYILDLRSNSGGLLFATIEIARMWLQKGTIVNISARSNATAQRYDASNKALTDKPLTVLVDAWSASGTEILAGALQENNRATLIGEKTFGQGSIQSVRPLANKSGLAVTVAKFLTPNCNQIESVGITPQVLVKPTKSELVKLRSDSSLLGSSEDSVYNQALETLRSQL